MVLLRDLYMPLIAVIALVSFCDARIHQLTLKNETRSIIHLNTFGFYANGTLEFQLVSLRLSPAQTKASPTFVGFSLAKSRVNGVLAYNGEEADSCVPQEKANSAEPLAVFIIHTTDPPRVELKLTGEGQDSVLTAFTENEKHGDSTKGTRKKRSEDDKTAVITPTKQSAADKTTKDKEADKTTKEGEQTTEDENGKQATEDKKDDKSTEDKKMMPESPVVPGKEGKEEKKPQVIQLKDLTTPAIITLSKNGDDYSFSFNMTFGALAEGLYNLNFHNCFNRLPAVPRPYTLSVKIVERNLGGFLSAAEIPLPRLYISMAAVFFGAALIWVYTLMKHRYSVFKIHWLMAALAFTKAISLVFHSINYHFINTEGHPIEGWAVMYYITHLLKGALLFITLALIGTGWAFVKYILSDNEKKIFMIVIPLQVLANVAYIIIESTEEGSSEYALWKEILFLVDLICCGAILFPVVWSIRHLQEASTTDGKAAMNLEKLKLFRHYYVMIVCYIYFTRIIAILLKVTVPFQWQWCYEFLVEVSTLIFFVLTGFKFRPASNNPYLQLPQDEEDMEMDEVLTESGALEGITKVKKTSNGRERQREAAL
ncbi:protein GPR108 isoform X2 [Sardina pilchardus]|uniref:protein GPR108 isoform X2 n=1 Tax=Sardina pilchardus TaxID=27697 RepID=UPI002E128EC4